MIHQTIEVTYTVSDYNGHFIRITKEITGSFDCPDDAALFNKGTQHYMTNLLDNVEDSAIGILEDFKNTYPKPLYK